MGRLAKPRLSSQVTPYRNCRSPRGSVRAFPEFLTKGNEGFRQSDVRVLRDCLADHRECPGSPGISTPPTPFGAADRTFIRVNLLLSVAKHSAVAGFSLATRLPMGRLAKPRLSSQVTPYRNCRSPRGSVRAFPEFLTKGNEGFRQSDVRVLRDCLADHRECPGSPGISTPPTPFGAADRTFIRVNLLLSVAKHSAVAGFSLATRLPMGRLAKPRLPPQVTPYRSCRSHRRPVAGLRVDFE